MLPLSQPSKPEVELKPEEILHLEPSQAGTRALLMTSLLFSTIREMRTLTSPAEREVFELLLLNLATDLIPADSGAVVIDDAPAPDKYEALVGRVRQEQVAMLIDEADQSIIAAPLLVRDLVNAGLAEGAVQGVIYLTSSRIRFDEQQLQLLAAVAVMAAAALEYRRTFDWLLQENERLQAEIDLRHSMVGDSTSMKALFEQIRRVSQTDSTVLILGESGTGKELVARAVHQNSNRATRPFVAVNCAALTDTLLESELFGHEKGSFTGAIAQKRGKLEMGEGGTVFLDEIGEMSPLLQAKLLRVLQEREFERVGGTKPLKLNIRLIAATNRDLQAQARSGHFREDLFYRLNVVTLRTPPLRERRSDIMALAEHFMRVYGERTNRKIHGISPRAQRVLTSYDWPGNVRELQNAIERAVVMGNTDLILPEDLPEELMDSGGQVAAVEGVLQAAVREAKRKVVADTLSQTQGNFTRAAQLLGVHVNYLHRLVNNLDLRTGRGR